MAYNLEPRTIKENLLGLIGKNPHAEPRPANTREECFLADIAENGGGGGGLPPYTSADVDKALTVKLIESGQTTQIIIPEQTVTTVEGEVEIPNIGTILSLDTDAIMTVNGTPLQATYNSSQQYWAATSGDYAYTMTLLTKGGERVLFSVWDTVNEH